MPRASGSDPQFRKAQVLLVQAFESGVFKSRCPMDFDGPLTNIEFNGNLSAHEPFGYELDDFSLSISQRSPSIRPKRTSHETFSSFAIYLQCIDDAGKKFSAATGFTR